MKEVGATLRKIREERKRSLTALAKACGVSASFLSQAERGLCSISIDSLERVCQQLGVSLTQFFAQMERSRAEAAGIPPVLRAEEQRAVNLSDAAIKYRFLSREFAGRLFEVVIGEIPPEYVFPAAVHEGEEFGYILSGTLRLTLQDSEHRLSSGDSYHFGPFESHGYEAMNDAPVRILWVQTLKDLNIRSGMTPAELAQQEALDASSESL